MHRAQAPLEKLRVAYTVIAPTQATVWTAKDLGLFAKHGLDVDLVLLVGAPLAIAALVSGETPIVHAGASAVVTSNLQGSGTVLVAGGANRFPYVLFVTDEIKRVEDLRGKKFGVSRIGSADHAAAITVFDKLGVKETEITYVQAGNIPARLAAMQGNALQATLLQAPETLKAKELGFRALLDFTKLDVEWQQNGVAVTRDYIKKKPDTVRRFLRAYVEGSHYNLTNAKGAQKDSAKISGDQRRKVGRRSLQRNRRQADQTRALSHRARHPALSRPTKSEKSQSRPGQTKRFYRREFFKGTGVQRLHRQAV